MKGVTDTLIELAQTGKKDLIDKIIQLHSEADLIPADEDDLRDALRSRLTQLELKEKNYPAYLDSVAAFGDELSARALARKLGYNFVNAKDILNVSSDFGNARILNSSKHLLKTV